jgi:hypothetical protein
MRRALILIVLVPLAVGCGAKKDTFAGAPGAMNDAGSSRIEMTVREKDHLLFSGTGAIDYSNNRGELVMKTEDKSFFPLGTMRLRFFGRTTYVGWTLRGKLRWMKEVEDPTGTDRFIPGPGGVSPDRVLQLIVKSSTRVEILDTETIRGVAAKHYRGHLDPKKLGEGSSGKDPSAQGAETVIDAWIDEDGLVRRLRVPDAGDSMLMDFFDFGTNVDVEVPPAEEIISDDKFFTLVEQECKSSHDEAFRGGELCKGFLAIGSGGGGSSGPIETTPRTVTDPK